MSTSDAWRAKLSRCCVCAINTYPYNILLYPDNNPSSTMPLITIWICMFDFNNEWLALSVKPPLTKFTTRFLRQEWNIHTWTWTWGIAANFDHSATTPNAQTRTRKSCLNSQSGISSWTITGKTSFVLDMMERNNNNYNLSNCIPAVPKCTNDPLLGIIPSLMIIHAFRNFNVCAIGWLW